MIKTSCMADNQFEVERRLFRYLKNSSRLFGKENNSTPDVEQRERLRESKRGVRFKRRTREQKREDASVFIQI